MSSCALLRANLHSTKRPLLHLIPYTRDVTQVCVPMDPAMIWDFDPEAVPTVAQLLRELNVAGGPAASQQWGQTSMAPSMRYFNAQFLQPLVADSHRCLSEKARAAATQPSLAW